MASNSPPSGFATPDDQGNLGLCTRFALAKAIANGCMEKYFPEGQELDFDQGRIAEHLVNLHQVRRRIY